VSFKLKPNLKRVRRREAQPEPDRELVADGMEPASKREYRCDDDQPSDELVGHAAKPSASSQVSSSESESGSDRRSTRRLFPGQPKREFELNLNVESSVFPRDLPLS
jgi:hypothetical protein